MDLQKSTEVQNITEMLSVKSYSFSSKYSNMLNKQLTGDKHHGISLFMPDFFILSIRSMP